MRGHALRDVSEDSMQQLSRPATSEAIILLFIKPRSMVDIFLSVGFDWSLAQLRGGKLKLP